MTEYDPPLGSLPDQDHDHDVLLVAGSRPEVARLAHLAGLTSVVTGRSPLAMLLD